MGNAQSTEEQPRRPPNRLSKPRTNNSTSNLLSPNPSMSSNLALRTTPPSDLSLSTSKRSSIAASPAVTPEEEVDMAPARPPTKRRRSLFRSKSSKPQPEEEAKEPPKREAPPEAADEPLHRYSRLNSTMSSEVPGDTGYFYQESLSQRPAPVPTPPIRSPRRASYVPYAQQSTRLSLVVEQNSPEPMTDDKSKQLGQIEENGIQREGSMSNLPRSMSIDSHIAIPIRRRSLLTPGIATRNSWTDNDLSRNSSFTQQQTPDTDYLELRSDAKRGTNRMPTRANTAPVGEDVRKWSQVPVRFEQYPLAELAATEEYDMPRITTPSDLDYGHLGSYKLGSLRITNGTASPATEGGSRQSSAPAPSQPTSYSSAYWVSGEHELEQAAAELGDISWVDPERQYSDYPNSYTNEPEELSEQFAYAPIEPSRLSLPEGFDAPIFTNPRSPTRAFEMAQAYMNEIASSPFSFDDSPETPPTLQATSKHTANEDHLFDDDAETPIHNSTFSDVKDKRSTSILSSTTNSGRPEQPNLSRTPSEDSCEPSAKAFKPLTKSDSGYSSTVSLKSDKADIPKLDNTKPPLIDLPSPPIPPKDPPPTPPKALYSRNSYGFRQPNSQRMSSPVMQSPPMKSDAENEVREIYGLTVSKSILQRPPVPRATSAVYTSDLLYRPQPPFRAPPPVPVKDGGGPVMVPQETPLTPDKSPEQLWAAGALHPLTESLPKRAPLDSRQSMPVMRRQDWQLQHNPSDSESSVVSLSRTRRLGKKRPSSTQTVTVQCFQEIDHSRIPQVSKDQSASLEARLKALPLLEHTYKTINRTNSKETLATILSQGTFEEQAAHAENFNRFEGPLPHVPDNDAIEQVAQEHRVEIGRAVPKAAKGRKSRDASFSRSRSRDTVTTVEPALSPKPVTGRKSYDFSIGSHPRRSSVEAPEREVSPDDGIQDEFESQITSFDGINASLGESAYQVAADAILPRPRSNSITSTSVAAPRMIDSRGRTKGMGSEAAAKLARDRSERRKSLSKDESYGNKPGFDDRGGSPGRMVFPNDEEMPPVPALPETVPVWTQQTRRDVVQKKARSSPPVAMTTRKQAFIPAPDRNVPILSVDTTSKQETSIEQTAENTKEDPWQAQRKMWADRRQSATQALTRSSHENLKAVSGDPWLLQKTPSNEQQPSWHTLPSQRRHSELGVGGHSIASLPTSPKIEERPSQAHLQRKEELFLTLFAKDSFEKLSSKKVQRKSLPPNARTYSLTSQTSQTSQAPSIQQYPVQRPRLPIHPDQESDAVEDYTIYDETDGGALTSINSNTIPQKQSHYQNDLSAKRDGLSENLVPYGGRGAMNQASYDSLDSLSYHGAHPRPPTTQTAPGSVRTSFDAASINGKRAMSMSGSFGGPSYFTPVSMSNTAFDENSLQKQRVVSEGANYAKLTYQNANYVKPAYQQSRFDEVRVPISEKVRPVRPRHSTSNPAMSMSGSAPATASPLSYAQFFNRGNVLDRYGGGLPFGELNNMESGRKRGERRVSSGGSYMNGRGGRSISPGMDGVDLSDVPVLVRSGNGLRV